MLTSPFPPHGDRSTADKVFGATAGASRRARAFVCDRLAAWGLSELADTAELITSELVTNAVTATNAIRTPPMASSMFPVALRMIAVRLRLSARSLFVEVWDVSDVVPVARQSPETAETDELGESGRGLFLIGALSKEWGCYAAQDRGKIVWCEIALPGLCVAGAGPQRLPRRVRRHPPAERATGPDEDTLLSVLDGLRNLA
jgi:anti-sigma regulatory factor (Ser/Thr protein kinase)